MWFQQCLKVQTWHHARDPKGSKKKLAVIAEKQPYEMG